ncbi:3-deoxy-7-phosphoheptulonate synthase [Blochmannia endosymbiont of Polyrhachis (Hedomyrma) turneri]|uniref:3-deoxy-7-phosphoheptulonate synthase n=1 Tax=Blochmannia endosymbiont of Polyrhachis (Hedomyrma) turneri TaxID=1505596 RepID=UPI00061A68E8|nr:3-deoxy-7-phosphoheptulonate synthase [Blochmannia endosymbiont of Polyrhachis (Hedomyrma) turneri]AKC59759.1 Phospho-2-dehydro-3-deoxyheptonate aldolase, Tyr-sensitive [Blochmannia endosymbiont of Polyrhachis (Hedomyrma) turneri]
MLNCKNNFKTNSELCIITPEQLKRQFFLKSNYREMISCSRQVISDIIHRLDSRFLVICGPCSIHDVNSAIDYAKRLKQLSDELCGQLYIVMRVYLEKPRTSIGWKGIINDPYMDGSCNIESGLKVARSLLLELIDIGVPLATEALDPNISQYLNDCFSWSAIGARTSESQVHREMASGLCMPVGFKNSTNGSLEMAINAIHSVSIAHSFIGISQSGHVALLRTTGNSNSHIILRGGKHPNYYPEDILYCEKMMFQAGLPAALMIDCSHGNSNKEYNRQLDVAESVLSQIKSGNRSIFGLMLESHIYSGNQSVTLPVNNMRYGVSVTDPCIDWDSTKKLLRHLCFQFKQFSSSRLL